MVCFYLSTQLQTSATGEGGERRLGWACRSRLLRSFWCPLCRWGRAPSIGSQSVCQARQLHPVDNFPQPPQVLYMSPPSYTKGCRPEPALQAGSDIIAVSTRGRWSSQSRCCCAVRIASCWSKMRWNLSTNPTLWEGPQRSGASLVGSQMFTHGGKHLGLKISPLVRVYGLKHPKTAEHVLTPGHPPDLAERGPLPPPVSQSEPPKWAKFIKNHCVSSSDPTSLLELCASHVHVLLTLVQCKQVKL